MQLAFGDVEDLGQPTQTRQELFLVKMDEIVPLPKVLKLNGSHHPALVRPDRQPCALAEMLRIRFLQQWYAVSAPAMEEAMHDTQVISRG